MSSKTKRKSSRGVRYDAAKQQEVVDFVNNFNAVNGRGGQATASKKFGITQLTIGGWLKRSGKPVAKKTAAKSKSTKMAKVAKVAGQGRGRRYSDAERSQVIDFVMSYNQQNGRGGQAAAVKKFGLTALTVATWLKAAGAPKPGKKLTAAKAVTTAKSAKTSVIPAGAPQLVAKVGSLLNLADQIRVLEKQLDGLRVEFDKQRSAVRAAI